MEKSNIKISDVKRENVKREKADHGKSTRGAAAFDPYAVLKAPLSAEKAIRLIEFENKLVFIVDQKATKHDVKKAVEQLFNVKVATVNIHNAFQGEKRAYVRLTRSSLASDVSADLGLI